MKYSFPIPLLSQVSSLVLCLGMTSQAHAEDPQERPALPSWSIAGDDGAASTWSNPANLALDPDNSWFLLFNQGVNSDQKGQFAAIQNRGRLATGLIYRNAPDQSAWTTLSTGLGLPLDKNLAIGAHLGWQIPEGEDNNFVSWDVGLSWRPLPWMGVSGVARNIGMKDTGILDLPTTFGGGVTFRPWENRLLLSTDALWEEAHINEAEPIPNIVASIRFMPTNSVQIRASGDSEGEVSAGLQFFFGNGGLGVHGRSHLSDGVSDALVYASSADGSHKTKAPDDEVIYFDLTANFPYQPSSGFFGTSNESYLHLLERIHSAVHESNTPAIFFKMSGVPFSMAQISEIQNLIDVARNSGKLVVAYLDGDASNRAFMLASAADKILIHPAANLNFVGLSAEMRYFRETMDMVGVEPQFVRRAEYKSGPEPYIENASSPASKEQTEALLDDLTDIMMLSIAKGRNKEADNLKVLVDQGPFTAKQALEHGLVDHIAYPDEMENMKALIEAGLPDDYEIEKEYSTKKDTPGWKGRQSIAVIYVVGTIMDGESISPGIFGGSRSAGSDTIVRQLEEAREDDDVAAVILRVDSPGGSAFASDEIWRAVERIKQQDKPVVVSMGGVAASGGYYVSAGADTILAEAGTITGSIGVYGGKFSGAELFDKLGVRSEIYRRGRRSALYTPSRAWDEVELAGIDNLIDEVYSQFKDKVGEGRGLNPEEVEEVARGRVWSGTAAKKQGLVDELGGFYDAVARAKTLAEIDPSEEVSLMTYSDTTGPDGQLRQTFLRMMGAQMELPTLPPEIRYLYDLHQMQSEGTWMLLPYQMEIR